MPVMDFIYIHGKLSTFLNLTYESCYFVAEDWLQPLHTSCKEPRKRQFGVQRRTGSFCTAYRQTGPTSAEKLAAETNSSSQLKSIEVNSIHLFGHFGPPLTKHGAFEAIGQAKAHSFMADDQRDREATEASVRQGPCGQLPCNGLQRFATAQRVVNGDRFGDGHLGHQQWQLAITTLGANL